MEVESACVGRKVIIPMARDVCGEARFRSVSQMALPHLARNDPVCECRGLSCRQLFSSDDPRGAPVVLYNIKVVNEQHLANANEMRLMSYSVVLNRT